MRKINLNIKIDDLKPEKDFKDKKGYEVAETFILNAFNYLQRVPKDPRNPSSAGLTVSEQRKVYKVMDAVEKTKDGIVELDDDLHEFLKKTFNETKWVGGTKIVVRVADAIDEVLKE